MELLTKELPKNANIFIGGDTHEGTLLKYHKGIKELKYLVNHQKNNYFIHMGDVAEAITVDDKRYQAEIQDSAKSVPLLQYQNAKAELDEIKKKTLVILIGNHDWKLLNYGNFVRDIICRELNISYGTYTCVLTLVDASKHKMIRLFLTHGSGTLRSTADDPQERIHIMRRALRRKLQLKAGDCEVMIQGHSHRLVVTPPTTEMFLNQQEDELKHYYTHLEKNGNFIPRNLRWYGCSGSFLKIYEKGLSSYAELMGLDPTELGCLLLKIRDGKVLSLEPFPL